MRRLTATLCLTIAMLLFSATEGFSLPSCPTDTGVVWTDCFGTYTFADGDKYVGEWRDDKRNGQGTATYADGGKYVGEWRDNKRHGQGTYTYADGRIEEGIWKDGEFQYAQMESEERKKELIRKAEEGNSDAQYQLALKYKNGDGVEKNLPAALSWASKAYRQGHTEGGNLYAELIFQDFVYGSDVRALENLGKSVATLCENDIKCAFDKVWAYLDLTGDGNLSLSEIARFQRNIIKMVALNQDGESLETEEIAAINFASIIFLPITASSILHSFDYNNDGLLSKDEVFGETEFAKLVGLDSKDFAKGIDFKILGERLQQTMDLIPLFK